MVFKKANVVCMPLMKAILLIATIDTIWFNAPSASANCPEAKTEKPVAGLPSWKNEEAAAIADATENICKTKDQPCGHACPNKKGKCVEEMMALMFGRKKCTLVCSCEDCQGGSEDRSVKEAWSLWLESKKDMENKNKNENPCDTIMPAGEHKDRCNAACPTGCKHKCQEFSFGISIPLWKSHELCFCIPPNEKQHIPLPSSSAHAIHGFCDEESKE